MEDGSPLDALVFLVLIGAGLTVLGRRQVRLAELARENAWLTAFFVYCFLAIVWSDFPFVALKRWIKILGHPVMALVILTERDPVESLRCILKRAAYILVPFSVTAIKYYPRIGRGFDPWSGQATNNGINLNKNELGYVCMIAGIFFVWNLLVALRSRVGKARRDEIILSIVFLAMTAWLLKMSRSSTALACVMIGIVTMVGVGFRFVSKRYLGTVIVSGIIMAVAAELTFGVYERGVRALGRDPTLTDRTEVWGDALELVSNPVLGAGFESFWLGDRLDKLWEKWWWRPNQAHNGYIEVYLNLGLVGLFLLVGLIVSTFHKIKAELMRDLDMGRLRLAFLFVILAYNYTEATFKGVHLVWLVFHLIAIDYRTFHARLVEPILAKENEWIDLEPDSDPEIS